MGKNKNGDMRPVLSRKALPMRSPLLLIAVTYLLLENHRAPGWAYGAAAVVAMLFILVWVKTVFHDEVPINPFEEPEDEGPPST